MNVKLLNHTKDILNTIYTAGKTCYSSSTPECIWEVSSSDETLIKYVQKILESGHHSVLEHVNFTFAISGVSRALLAQISRHRHCLSGDTLIPRYSGGRKNITLRELYKKWQDNQRKCTNSQLTIRTVNIKNSEVILPTKIKNVFYNGVQEVYEVTTKLGYKIKATKDHIFYNSSGEFLLSELGVGDKVYVNGIELYKDKEWFTNKYVDEGLTTVQIADICSIKAVTARKWKRIHKIETNNENFKREFSESTRKKISQALSGRQFTDEHRLKLSLVNKGRHFKPVEEVSRARLAAIHRENKLDKCQICGATDMLEAHHIDRDYKNYSKENCFTVCASCHHKLHGSHFPLKKVFEDTITSITLVGEEDVYDLETMEDSHCYIANGFLVHNCSMSAQSQRYVEFKEDYWSLKSLLDDATCADENIAIKACAELEDLAKKYFVDVTPANSYHYCQSLLAYLDAINAGAKPEDARMHLPNATKTNMVLTTNLRELIHICKLRLCSRAQKEIRDMVKAMVDEVLAITEEDTSWLKEYLQPQCEILGYCPEIKCCGRKKKLGDLINGN